MAKCKYKKREHLISYDGGQSWVIDEVIKGDLVQSQSPDCPDSGSEITKWVVLDNDFICEDKNKYQKEVMYVSYDKGVSWYINFPTVYRKGILIGVDETFCSNKFEGHYIISDRNIDPLKIIKCDSNTTLTNKDTKYYGGIDGHFVDIVSAKIGQCVTSIEGGAFYSAITLTSIDIPDSVTSIGNNAFRNCTSLTTANIQGGSIGSNAFSYCTSLTSITIGNNVTTIGGEAFHSCHSLKSINIPTGLTSIGFSAFEDCSGLTTANIQGGSIGNYAFRSCANLTSCTIGDCITSIGSQVFSGCRSLTSCTIGSGITNIGSNAFSYCTSLQSITITATTPPALSSNVFANTNDCPIYVPASAVQTYKSASGWSTYASRIFAMP